MTSTATCRCPRLECRTGIRLVLAEGATVPERAAAARSLDVPEVPVGAPQLSRAPESADGRLRRTEPSPKAGSTRGGELCQRTPSRRWHHSD